MSGNENEVRNNLLNVTIHDPAFKLTMLSLLNLADEVSKDKELLRGLAATTLLPIAITDFYNLHYTVMPLIANEKNPSEFLEIARKVMEGWSKTGRYATIKKLTTLNDELSRVYTISLIDEFIKELKKLAKDEKNKELREFLNKARNLGRQFKDAVNALTANPQIQQGGSSQQSTKMNKQIQELTGMMERIMRDRDLMKRVGEALAVATRKASKKTEKFRDVKELVGGTKAGKDFGTFRKLLDLTNSILHIENAEAVISLSKKLVETMDLFEKISKVTGKFGEEVSEYGLTDNPEYAIPEELALPDELFYAKLASSSLLRTFKRSVTEGAYYVLIDKSGSMEGSKTVWARSVALAIYRKAMRKKRKFFLRFFDARVYDLIRNPIEAMESIMKIESSGGTDITKALMTALEDLRKEGLNELTNTVIIITDGEDDVRLPPRVFRENNATLVAVMIQGHNHALRKIAIESGGQYLTAELTKDGALKLLSLI